MYRFAKFALGIAAALALAIPCSAQQGTTGGQQKGTTGTAGQQQGTTGTVGQQQGTTGTVGQQQKGTTGSVGQQQGTTGKVGQQQGAAPAQIQSQLSFYRGTPGQKAWFGDQGIRKQLNLTDQQYNKLNQAYGKYSEEYNKGMGGAKNLPGAQQAQKTAELSNNFHNQMMQAAQGALNPNQIQRFNQLHMQSQGFGIFNNPQVVQKLNLTPQQRDTLQAYAARVNLRLAEIQRTRANDGTAAAQDYNALRKQNDEVLRSTLNQTQLQSLGSMWGEPYNFLNNGGGQ